MAIQFISPLHGSLARAVDRASVDGIVAVGLGAAHPEVGQIRRSGLPFVVVDSTALPGRARHRGRRRGWRADRGPSTSWSWAIGSSSSIGIEPPIRRRTDGARRGHRPAPARLPRRSWPPRAWSCPITRSSSARPASRAASTPSGGRGRPALRPTAVLAMSDAMAIGAMRAAARARACTSRRTCRVVGFDDVDVAKYTDPPLTTVHQPIRRKGEEAVRLLLGGGRSATTGRSEQQRSTRGSSSAARPARRPAGGGGGPTTAGEQARAPLWAHPTGIAAGRSGRETRAGQTRPAACNRHNLRRRTRES